MKVVSADGHKYLVEEGDDSSYCIHGVEIGAETCKDCEAEIDAEMDDVEPEEV